MTKYILILYAVILLCCSCREIIDPELHLEEDKIPVIEGIVTNKPGESYVLVSYATEFSKLNFDTSRYEARVNLIGNDGTNTSFIHSNNGLYLPFDSTFKGNVGDKYQLEVELNNELYATSYIEMLPAATIDSVYARPDTFLVIEKNVQGNIYTREKYGLTVFYSILSSNNKKQYFLGNSRFIYLSTISSVIKPTEFLWEVKKVLFYHEIPPSENFKDLQVVKNINGGFMEYVGREPKGWIVEINCSSIEKDTYFFHQRINAQLENENSLFDPIPYQIKGNIFCKSDSSQKVFGNFRASGRFRAIYAFRYIPGWDYYLYERMDENLVLPEEDGMTEGYLPYFWPTAF
jgi:hypothetical protein